MKALAQSQKITSIEEFRTYIGMNRFVVLPEDYKTQIGLWILIDAITDQETPDAFNLSHYAVEHKQISSYCDRIFSPLSAAFNVFMIDFEDCVILFDEDKDLDKYVADAFLDLEESYTLYLTEEFLDQLIEIDKEEKKAWCKNKIKTAKSEIKSFEKQIAKYEEILSVLD